MDDLKFIPLSEARHDLHLYPNRFKFNPLPVLVEHRGQPTMAIVPIDLYAVLEGAMDFIKENGHADTFETWLDEEGIMAADNDEQEEEEGSEALPVNNAFEILRAEGWLEKPEVRQAMREHCLKTLAELDSLEQSEQMTR